MNKSILVTPQAFLYYKEFIQKKFKKHNFKFVKGPINDSQKLIDYFKNVDACILGFCCHIDGNKIFCVCKINFILKMHCQFAQSFFHYISTLIKISLIRIIFTIIIINIYISRTVYQEMIYCFRYTTISTIAISIIKTNFEFKKFGN